MTSSLTCLRRVLLVALLTLAMGAARAQQLDAQLDAIRDYARYSPQRALTELQRLEPQALRAAPDIRAYYLDQLGIAHLFSGQRDEALAVAAELRELAEKTHSPVTKAHALLLKSRVLATNDEMAESNRLTWEAAQLAADGPPVLRLRTQITAGQAWAYDGKFDKAVASLLEAAESAEQQQRHHLAIQALDVLADVYVVARDYAKGLEVLEQGLALAARTHADVDLAWLRISEYRLAQETGQFARAEHALELALAWARKNGSDELTALAAVNLADFYLKHNQPDRAFRYADEMVGLLERSRVHRKMAPTAYLNRGQALLMLGRRDEAKRDFDIAFRTLTASGDKPQLMSGLEEYAAALEKTGDYRGATAALRREREVSEELFNEQRTQALLKLQQEYDVSKREAKIALLRRDNQSQLAELAYGRRIQQIWAVLALVGLVAATLLGALYRKLRRTNAQLHSTNRQLADLSQRDPLTLLYNRRHFHQFMASLPRHERRAAWAPGAGCIRALYLLDIDHFKRINDTHGHAAGDAVLKMVAERLRQILRETDMIVRWGGEEFLAFLPSVPHDKLDEVAQRILSGIATQLVEFQGKQIAVQVSLGYTQLQLLPESDELPWERMLGLADEALYLAKNTGRNRAYGLRSIVDARPATQQRVEEDLDGAWREGLVDLELVQP